MKINLFAKCFYRRLLNKNRQIDFELIMKIKSIGMNLMLLQERVRDIALIKLKRFKIFNCVSRYED